MKRHALFAVITASIVSLGAGFALSAAAADTAITEKSFACIHDGGAVKIRQTYIRNPDPAKLKEAVQIFEGNLPGKEYPLGTTIQLVPGEAMVKESKKNFPNTNGWEFFALTVSADGTKIASRGDSASNPVGTCLGCHQPAAKFDFICEKTHGCAPIPVTDAQIAMRQDQDARCTK
jgi:hypothetical protein